MQETILALMFCQNACRTGPRMGDMCEKLESVEDMTVGATVGEYIINIAG